MKNPHTPLTATINIKDANGRVVGQRQVATFAGLLAAAHEQGLKGLNVELVQVPTKENGMVAIARATVITQRGTFADIGDASPTNTNARVAAHLCRVASTRAKSRALRDSVNIGCVALEELDELIDGDEAEPAPAPMGTRAGKSTAMKETSAAASVITEPQRRLLYRLASTHGVPTDKIPEWLCARVGVDSLRAVTRAQASALIERLQQNGSANEHDGEEAHG